MDINVYDIYNSTLEADKPLVDAIIAQLTADIQANLSNNDMYFIFDLAPYFSEEITQAQKNRVLDRVIFEVRNAGFSIRPMGERITTESVPDYIPMATTVHSMINVRQFEVYLKVRKDQEYMKSWC